jgi:S1-C subfamily serine protease
MDSARSVSRRYLALAGGVLICAAAASIGIASPRRSGANQAQGQPGQFRVIKSLCGTKSVSHGGEVELQDPRNVFHVPEDHQIVVYFEWDGPPGDHHAVGSWRSPDGKVALVSEFDLSSQGRRYIGTWALAIPESIATGLWALEAQIDGQPAGTQTFQIISSRSEAPAPPPMPTAAEIYQRASAASVFVTSLDENGETISRGFGFFVDKNTVLTAFQAIDGASSLRVDLADGSSMTIGNVVAWNRGQDWAILKVETSKAQPLEKAAPNSWKIGDLCYVLASQGQGSRTIQNVNITGLQGTVKSAQRLTISAFGGAAVGAPMVDGYGRVIGVLSGGLAGMGSRRMGTWASYLDPGQMATTIADPTVLPIAAIPEAAWSFQPVTFADLAAQGALILPLVQDSQAASGELCEDFQKFHGEAIMPVRPRRDFSKKQGSLALVVVWGPSKKLKSTQELRIYDADNRAVARTVSSKLDLQPRVTTYSAWKVPLSSLQPGIYRIDLVVGEQPHWREFFRLSD